MGKTMVEEFLSDPENKKRFYQENLILDCTERICELMDEQGVTKTELANRLGRTKGYITQLLDGRANMTLKTISDVFLSLGCKTTVRTEEISQISEQRGFMEFSYIPSQRERNISFDIRGYKTRQSTKQTKLAG